MPSPSSTGTSKANRDVAEKALWSRTDFLLPSPICGFLVPTHHQSRALRSRFLAKKIKWGKRVRQKETLHLPNRLSMSQTASHTREDSAVKLNLLSNLFRPSSGNIKWLHPLTHSLRDLRTRTGPFNVSRIKRITSRYLARPLDVGE